MYECRHTCTGESRCLMQFYSRAADDQLHPTWTGTPPTRALSGWCAFSSRCHKAERKRLAPGRSAGQRTWFNKWKTSLHVLSLHLKFSFTLLRRATAPSCISLDGASDVRYGRKEMNPRNFARRRAWSSTEVNLCFSSCKGRMERQRCKCLPVRCNHWILRW